MLRAVFATVFLLGAAIGAAKAATDDELRVKIVGYWGDTELCSGAVMVFRSDGSMVQLDIDLNRSPPVITMADGNFTIKDGKLSGTMNGKPMPTAGIRFDGNQVIFVEGREESAATSCPAGPQ